jgi:hypothetical protein
MVTPVDPGGTGTVLAPPAPVPPADAGPVDAEADGTDGGDMVTEGDASVVAESSDVAGFAETVGSEAEHAMTANGEIAVNNAAARSRWVARRM